MGGHVRMYESVELVSPCMGMKRAEISKTLLGIAAD